MTNTQELGKYTYYWEQENIEFTLNIDKYWETIYRGQPREELYYDYRMMLEFVKKVNKDRYILDIGVNHSLFATPCSLLGYKVVGFEPVKANFDSAVLNMAINNCKNFSLYNYAIGNVNEEVDIFVPICPDNSSFSPSAAVANMGNKNSVPETVRVIRFDDWVLENPKYKDIGLIKLDVQGYEKNVCLGMQEFLKQSNNIYLIAEFEDHLLKMNCTYEELHSLILSFGFKQISKIGNDRVYYKN